MCNSGHWGLCPKCMYLRDLTKHHVYPRRFFGNPPNAPILFLCRGCHDQLELIIPRDTPLHKDDYLQLAREFLTLEPMFI